MGKKYGKYAVHKYKDSAGLPEEPMVWTVCGRYTQRQGGLYYTNDYKEVTCKYCLGIIERGVKEARRKLNG